MACDLFNQLTRYAEGGFTRGELQDFGGILQTSLDQDQCPQSDLAMVDEQIVRTITKFIDLNNSVPDYQHQMGGMSLDGYDYLIEERRRPNSAFYQLHERVPLARATESAHSSNSSWWNLAPAGAGVILGAGTLICRGKLTRGGFKLLLFISAALILSSLGCGE
jgi:hypothetical protein